MAKSTGARSVDRINTATEVETERTPLLAGTPTPISSSRTPSYAEEEEPTTPTTTTITNNGHDDDDNDDDPANQPINHLRSLLRPRVLLLTFALLFLIELSIGTMVTPTNAIMESIICRQMHPDLFSNATSPSVSGGDGNSNGSSTLIPVRHFAGGVILADDPVCKGPDVQGYLAMLRGWQATFESVPGMLTAVPYGVLSDRWGRRGVLGLSLGGISLGVVWTFAVFYFSDVVPLWVMLFAAVFQLIGGGGQVFVAMMYTAIADVISVELRATVFFQIAAMFLGSQMVAGPLGGAMLVWGPWVPLLFGLAVLLICNLLIFVFPETVHLHDRKGAHQDQDADGDGAPGMTKFLQQARTGLAEVWDFILGNQSLAFLMVSLVFVILGRFVGELLLQYATKRYNWSWSFASMVLTVRSAGSLVTLLVVLPAASWLCVKRFGMSGVAKDLVLARWSGVVQIIGGLLIAAAPNGIFFSFGLVWFALGSGMSSLIRSLLNALVEEHHVGTVNSLVGFMETAGLIIAGPLLAKSLSVGLNLGGAWIGLPFVTAAVFFALSTAIVWTFRLPNKGRPSIEPSC